MSNFRQCDRETPYLLPPSVLLALLIYGYATGTFSSRRIEQASYESLTAGIEGGLAPPRS